MACRLPLRLLFTYTSTAAVAVVFAQADMPSGLTIGPGSTVTLGKGALVTVIGGDVHVQEGGTLHNDGELHVGRDLIVDGALQTTLGGSPELPEHGQIHVAGDAEYRGTLAVALARSAHFTEEQDFTIATYAAGFGTLAARKLPGADWSRTHYDEELVVTLKGRADDSGEAFAIQLDAALLDDRVIIDWIAQFDYRTEIYVVERFDQDNGWREIGRTGSISGDASAAYYSTVDHDLPEQQQLLRYRVRLRDAEGDWNLTDEVQVAVGTSPELRVFPNPASGTHVRVMGIDFARGFNSMRLVDPLGRTLKTYESASRSVQLLDLPDNLEAALHYVHVEYEDGTRESAPLLVVRQ